MTIPMALPTYDRLCQVSGAENNVALVALCAGSRNLWEKIPGRLKFDCKVRPSYDQDSLASSGFSLSFVIFLILQVTVTFVLPSSLMTMQVMQVP